MRTYIALKCFLYTEGQYNLNYIKNTEFGYLNTNFYYSYLNEGYNYCQNEAFYNAAKKKLTEYSWNEDVSDKILKALCYVYKKSFNNNFERDICKYLYFWLGNILIENMSHNTVFFDVIRDLFSTLKKNNIEKICELPHPYMDVNHFKNIKLFFDYSEDYYSYKHQLKGNNHSCNNKYKNYLYKYVNSYKEVKVECAENKNPNSYCNEFNHYFDSKDDNLLSKWKCNFQENGHEHPELEEVEVPKKPPLSPGPVTGVHPTTFQNKVSSVRGQEGTRPSYSGYPLREATDDLNIISDSTDESSISATTKSIASAASAAGLLVPPFLVYNVITIVIVQQNFLFYI
ncbi:hypothetical protein PVMG_06092 [Plasmodium vivax Mauritania I]|uniref:Uncharacterized protein n=1 Tax=Plasmodium vivax Mauritania I TaxID=1035515 RepID=A0A0J9TIV8_PLAVI|nr:hypothetical protein PVMG_06092 [Plasmodium vivax Mauritania I]